MTYEEIRKYVRLDNQLSEVREIGSYESEPYPSWMGHDEHGDDIIEDTTCTVTVHLLGDAPHGYILTTHDDADGPTDGLGREVYATAAAAVEAMKSRGGADILPAGEQLIA